MHGKHTMCDSLSVGAFLLSHSYTSQFIMVSHIMDGLHSMVALLFLSVFLPSYTMHTQTYTIHTTHSEPTLLEFIESATTPSLNMGHKM